MTNAITMAGRQRTFELVPTTLVIPTDQPQRMTSKQVKKAYQKKNKGPKITRAEQRRLDAAELAKQKTEYEREKASVRSKVARDKKTAKEQAEKAERRKNGVLEPSRFVRASQPMISMFVKKGNKRSWEQMDGVAEESDGTACEEEEREASQREQTGEQVAVYDDSDDEFSDFPSLSQSDIPELLDSPFETPPEEQQRIVKALHMKKQRMEIAKDFHTNEDDDNEAEEDSQQLPPHKITYSEDSFKEKEVLDHLVEEQLLSEAAEAANRDEVPSSPPRKPIIGVKPFVTSSNTSKAESALHSYVGEPSVGTMDALKDRQKSPSMIEKAIPKYQRPVLQDCSSNMRPPILKAAKSILFAATPPELTAMKLSHIQPPSATQAFIENHIDDFFPSPSQEIRELLEDVDDIPSNTQVAKELDSDFSAEPDLFGDLFLTQDFGISSQDLLDIDTPSRPPAIISTSFLLPTKPPKPKPKGRFFVEKEDDMVHAAIHESKLQIIRQVPKVVPLNDATAKRSSRTLHRIQSVATDYGDDEIDDEELLALSG